MAYSFTAASSQSITLGSAPVTTVPLTIAAWVRPSDVTNNTSKTVVALGTYSDMHQLYQYNLRVNQATFRSSVENNAGYGSNFFVVDEYAHVCGVESSWSSRQAYGNGTGGSANTTSVSSYTVSTAYIGKISSNAQYAYGKMAEIAIWDVALTANEIASLAKGFKPTRIRPQSLVFYAPLIRNLQDVRAGRALTNNNTATVADHPRVY